MSAWQNVRRCLLSVETKVPVAFWLFGVCNNFAYVIMLSAANDILTNKEPHNSTASNETTPPPPTNSSHHRNLDCNLVGTGAILLADILPTLIVKATGPGFIQKISFAVKTAAVAVLALISLLVVALSRRLWLSLLGVASASLSAGLGEITFLSLTASYETSSLSGWSSGTGFAGVLGALSYTGLTALLSPRTTILSMTVVPGVLLLAYFVLLPPPWRDRASVDEPTRPLVAPNSSITEPESDEEDRAATPQMEPDWRRKFSLLLPMLEFMVPLALVYFFEYLINQALHELLYFPGAFIKHREQYRWYQAIYQIGVFLSRSSLWLFTFRYIWILCLLQAANFALLLLQVIFFFIPSIFVVFGVILFEGMLGGLAYVNTFHFILQLLPRQYSEYRMGAASVGDSIGIAVAGAVAVPLHNFLCANL